MTHRTLAPFAFSLLLTALPAGAQELIANGSFEQPGFTAPLYYRFLDNGDATTISNWTASDDGIGERSYLARLGGNGHGDPYKSSDGQYSVYLNQGTALSTTFAATAGADYTLTFYGSLDGTRPVAEYAPLTVLADGLTTTFTNPEGIQTFHFTAPVTDSAATLRFSNPSTPGDYKIYVLDAVSLTPTPELSSQIALSFGMFGIGSLILRKRISA